MNNFYWIFHFCERAEYVFGLEDPLTQTLGEVYVKCLDAPKAGRVLFLQLLLKSVEAQSFLWEIANPLCCNANWNTAKLEIK
jgi:hypothetical protein